MKLIFLILLFSASSLMAQPKAIVVGGNNNSTLGQCIAGFSNTYHVGIRIPVRNITAVSDEDTPVFPFVGRVKPNPCNGIAWFDGTNIVTVRAYTITGRELPDAVDMRTQTITFPSVGSFIIKMTNSFGASKSITVISNK